MSDNRLSDAVMEMETDEFDDFYSQIESLMSENSEVVIQPESKIDARKWVFSYIKMKEEIEFYKQEYIPFLMEKYINPVKEKIEKLENAQDYIKTGLFDFLDSIDEKKITFPDLATVSEVKTQPRIIYPDDEESLIKLLVEEDSPYIINKPVIDKKRILSDFKESGDLPIGNVVGELGGTMVRITTLKKKEKKGD